MKSIFIKKIILFTLLSIFVKEIRPDSAYPLQDDSTMITKEVFMNNEAFHIGDLLVGSGNDEVTDRTRMIVEMQEGGFVIGEANMSKWGITCATSPNETKNSCYYDPKATPIDDVYRKNPFQLIDGYAYLRVNDKVKIDQSNNFFLFF
jgi:hypothetical protein